MTRFAVGEEQTSLGSEHAMDIDLTIHGLKDWNQAIPKRMESRIYTLLHVYILYIRMESRIYTLFIGLYIHCALGFVRCVRVLREPRIDSAAASH